LEYDGSLGVRKKLESDEAAEVGVFGLVNNSHAATAQFFNDAVVGDGLPIKARRTPSLWPQC
jgi:hypothetical protein